MIIVKRHRTPKDELMLALCDENVQGKVFTEGKLQLDCSADFYAGEACDRDAILDLLRMSVNANIVGHDAVALAREAGVVDDENVKTIDGVPYAYVFTIDQE